MSDITRWLGREGDVLGEGWRAQRRPHRVPAEVWMNGVGMFTVAHVLRLGRLTDLDGRQAGEYRNRVGCLAAWIAGRIDGCDVELVDLNPRRASIARALGVRS